MLAKKITKRATLRSVQFAPMSGARTREVLDTDLDALASGAAEASTALALWPACMTLAVGLGFGLGTADHPSPQLVAAYVSVISVASILGIFFLINWIRRRTGAKQVLKKIRAMSPFETLEGVVETTESQCSEGEASGLQGELRSSHETQATTVGCLLRARNGTGAGVPRPQDFQAVPSKPPPE